MPKSVVKFEVKLDHKSGSRGRFHANFRKSVILQTANFSKVGTKVLHKVDVKSAIVKHPIVLKLAELNQWSVNLDLSSSDVNSTTYHLADSRFLVTLTASHSGALTVPDLKHIPAINVKTDFPDCEHTGLSYFTYFDIIN